MSSDVQGFRETFGVDVDTRDEGFLLMSEVRLSNINLIQLKSLVINEKFYFTVTPHTTNRSELSNPERSGRELNT